MSQQNPTIILEILNKTLRIHKGFYSVTTHQYIVNNTQFMLHVSVLSNHLQAIIH
jgi:hypothetical protein